MFFLVWLIASAAEAQTLRFKELWQILLLYSEQLYYYQRKYLHTLTAIYCLRLLGREDIAEFIFF
jgi:hypothetical protein